jgi:hypothetical protein
MQQQLQQQQEGEGQTQQQQQQEQEQQWQQGSCAGADRDKEEGVAMRDFGQRKGGRLNPRNWNDMYSASLAIRCVCVCDSSLSQRWR